MKGRSVIMATWFLVIIYLAFISLGIPDSILGVAWPTMQPDIGASFESAGLLSMVVAACTIVSSLVSGTLIQKIGTGKLTLISTFLTAGALLGFSFAPSMMWLVVLAIPLGLGAGAVDAGLNHYVANHYKAHHMSWLHCFWGVGATSGPIIMSYFLRDDHSWREGYTAVAIIQFSLVVILFLTLPLWKIVGELQQATVHNQGDEEVHTSEKRTASPSNKNPIHIKGVKMTLLAFLLYCGVELTVGLWGASYLVGAKGVNVETAALWVSLYYGGITVGRLVTGFITLKFNNRIIIRTGQLTAAVGGLLLLLPLPDIAMLAGFILVGLGLAPIYPGLIHETPARFGKENSAKLIGYQMAVAYTGTTFIPPIFGLLASNTTVGIFPAVVFLLLLLMWLSSEQVNRILSKNAVGER